MVAVLVLSLAELPAQYRGERDVPSFRASVSAILSASTFRASRWLIVEWRAGSSESSRRTGRMYAASWFSARSWAL
jgi:hypothetical protein